MKSQVDSVTNLVMWHNEITGSMPSLLLVNLPNFDRMAKELGGVGSFCDDPLCSSMSFLGLCKMLLVITDEYDARCL